ncbi:helix-turn-helix domain-containing protein [Streptomyces sp. GS7]|uniref:helix-turn-helix domain-containing protein n=1 Tax=Streptomyces sp. GS7 TaxID=2692234 RepID=UPI0013195CF2|nr:helix-turn-helix domain-containing protein [Streptomyces sp. GS7]
MSEEERVRIADLWRERKSIRTIAGELNRSPSTISREIRRNGNPNVRPNHPVHYRPFAAHRRARARRPRPKPRRIDRCPELREFVQARLDEKWSPEQPAVPDSPRKYESFTNKGVGYRWNDGKGNGIRIDKGNLNNSQTYQQVDHVVINSGGKVLGRDGKPLAGSIKQNAYEAHIPVTEWLKWKEWNRP